jgi:3-deoxy-D-manno-octulosonic-acid transferase
VALKVLGVKGVTELQSPPFAPPVGRGQILLAASTHEGEGEPILQAFTGVRAAKGPQFLIIAPRHPDRADAVASLVIASGLPFERRSRGEAPNAETAVYLADTLGEMAIGMRCQVFA